MGGSLAPHFSDCSQAAPVDWISRGSQGCGWAGLLRRKTPAPPLPATFLFEDPFCILFSSFSLSFSLPFFLPAFLPFSSSFSLFASFSFSFLLFFPAVHFPLHFFLLFSLS